MSDDLNKVTVGIIIAVFAVALYCCETPSSTSTCSTDGAPYQTCEVSE